MAQELISRCPEVPTALIDPIKVGTIQEVIRRNRASITGILILVPSVTIPAYYDLKHPIIGMILGGLYMAWTTVFAVEQMQDIVEVELEKIKSEKITLQSNQG